MAGIGQSAEGILPRLNQAEKPRPTAKHSKTKELAADLRSESKNSSAESVLEAIADKPKEASQYEKNLNVLSHCLKFIKAVGTHVKENPAEIAAALIPATLGSLAIFSATPIPDEILTRMSLGGGFGSMAYSRSRGSRMHKIGNAIKAATAGALFPSATEYIPMKKAVDFAGTIADDIPAMATVAKPAAKVARPIVRLATRMLRR